MNQLFNRFGRTVSSITSLYKSKLRSKLMQPQKAMKKLTADVKKNLQGAIKFVFGKPSSIKDYFHVNDILISKRFLAKAFALMCMMVIFWMKVGYPYLNGKLWPAILIVNTREYHEFNGKGRVYLENGNFLYQGQLKNGLAEGIGELYDEDGNLIFRGNFSKNKYNGDGELYKGQALQYKGQFLDNLFQGEGELFYQDGTTKFRGTFLTGEYQEGVEYYKSGRKKYVGAFSNGLYAGEATLFADDTKNNMIYTGGFVNGKYDGAGVLLKNGKLLYKGDFVNGQYSGMGILYKNQAVIYEGSFLGGKRNGEGRAYSSDGNYLIYEGTFKENLYDGIGTLYHYENGRMLYQGEFLQGEYQGEGILYGKSGQKLYEGTFYQDAIDYMQYINAEEPEIKNAFGKADAMALLESSYLEIYKQLGIAFEIGYVEMEETPQVERIRFWGEQTINGITTKMTLKEVKALFEADAVYTEYSFLAGEAEIAVSAYMQEDIQPEALVYSIKYILDGYYIRVYALEENGKICYFEVGGI